MYLPTHRRIVNLPSTGTADQRPNKVYLGALAAALTVIGAGIASIGLAAPAAADGDSIEITQKDAYIETFGEGSSRDTLQKYNGKQTYTASTYWLNTSHCNGMIISYLTPYNPADCNAIDSAPNGAQFNQENNFVRIKTAALGLLQNGVGSGTFYGSDPSKGGKQLDSGVKEGQTKPSQNRALSTNTTAGQERKGRVANFWGVWGSDGKLIPCVAGQYINGQWCSSQDWHQPGDPDWPISLSDEVKAAGGKYNEAMQVMIASKKPIKPEGGSAFLELSVDYAATACLTEDEINWNISHGLGNPNPHLVFQWLNAPPATATDANVVQSSQPVDICGNDPKPTMFASSPMCSVQPALTSLTRSNGVDYTIDGVKVHAVTVHSPLAHLFSKDMVGDGLYYRILNTVDQQAGNDGALDNVMVTVATPTIKKSFADENGNVQNTIVPGYLTWVQFTIKNTDDLAEKSGWSVTDILDPGLRIAIDDNNKPRNDCGTPTPPNPGMMVSGISAGGRDRLTITNGIIGAGLDECHIWVPVVADVPDPDNPDSTLGQQYQNCVTEPQQGDGGYLGDTDGIEIPNLGENCATIEVVPPKPKNPTAPACDVSAGQEWTLIDDEWVCVTPLKPSIDNPKVCQGDGEILSATENGLVCMVPGLPPVPQPPICEDGQVLLPDENGKLGCWTPGLPPVPPSNGGEVPVCTGDGEILLPDADGVLNCFVPGLPPDPQPPICEDGQVLLPDEDGKLWCWTPGLPPTPPDNGNRPICEDGMQLILSDHGWVCATPNMPTAPPEWGKPIAPHIPNQPVTFLPVAPGNPLLPIDPPKYPGEPDQCLPQPPFKPTPPTVVRPIVLPTNPPQHPATGVSELVMFEALAVTFAGLVVLNWRRTRRN